MRCIYRIDINDRYYIGSTVDFKERKRLHLAKLKMDQHPNKFLQNLYNKYGEDTFIFSIVESIQDDTDPLVIEQPYLDEHFGQENCVNLSPIAGGGFYYTRTPEIIQKQLDSRWENGNWFHSRYPTDAIKANTGSTRSDEFCERMSNHKKEFYQNNPDKLASFKNSAEKGRENRWERDKRPFVLIKNGVEHGPFDTQQEAFSTGILSNVSISRLVQGKLETVKGFRIKFIN